MPSTRCCGILLHPTALPGPYGIGDLGPETQRFVDYLAGAGVGGWQLLPLTPPGMGNSPYQSYSAFAGNPLLISLDDITARGWLTPAQLADAPDFPVRAVDFDAVTAYKSAKLHAAFAAFRAAGGEEMAEYRAFREEHAAWLDDYALFQALREAHACRPWTTWEPELVRRVPAALTRWRARLAEATAYLCFEQYLFFTQWAALHDYAHAHNVCLIGDMPIFIAHDSADAWSHPELFHLDADGHATLVAGVPPDYFSPTGQRWGNPLYNWPAHVHTGFTWWIDRVRHSLRLVDRLRLDHFRGFAACWEISAAEETAERGRWAPAPGTALFHALHDALGDLPLIAEDLGFITPDVTALRERFHLPGMAILQYAFGADRTPTLHQPHRYTRDTVAYTGTHDNDTILGWWMRTSATCSEDDRGIEASRGFAREYLQTDGWEIHWVCLRTLLASVADLVVIPLQDLLGLGSEARMNYPGQAFGNWGWRVEHDQLTDDAQGRLRWLLTLYERHAPPWKA